MQYAVIESLHRKPFIGGGSLCPWSSGVCQMPPLHSAPFSKADFPQTAQSKLGGAPNFGFASSC